MTGDNDHTTRCTIVPPHILERLALSGDAELAAAAREALIDLDARRLHRRAQATPESDRPRRPRLAAGSLEGGPVRLISDAQGGTRLPGTSVRGEGDPDTGDVAVTEAYDGLGDTWALYAEAFERNSLDARGLPLRASVHYGRDYDNAFWDGTQMVFGDGDGKIFGRFTASLDVIGHELAHGVTEHTAGLMYQGQPGALNESMSDVFGSLVKQRKLGHSADAADWLIGAELLIGELAGQALRSMIAPGTAYDNPLLGKDPQPGHMDDFVDTDEDHGGVHINSGIPNRAFALLATSLGGNAWEVPGRIWYAVLTGPGISADCDFVTFAGLTVDAAITTYGVDSPEALAVRSAWAQVGVLGPVDEGEDGSEPAGGEAGGSEPGPVADDGTPDPQPVPSRAVVQVRRSGGLAGLSKTRSISLEDLPAGQEQQWRSVLGGGTLQAIEARVKDGPSRAVPDGYCYGVICDLPPTDVEIPEQQLPDHLRELFEDTLADDGGPGKSS